MVKKLTTFALVAVLTGCAATPAPTPVVVSPAPMNVNAPCPTEIERIRAEFGDVDAKAQMQEYWNSQDEIVQTVQAATLLSQELPNHWVEDFDDEAARVFIGTVIESCGKPNATIATASAAAGEELYFWLIEFVNEVDRLANEQSIHI